MEKEWRGDPSLSGGGQMLDQGVHLIDLSRWFAGQFVEVQGRVERYFWAISGFPKEHKYPISLYFTG